MCCDPDNAELLSAREALARDLVNLPVETVSDALQIASDLKHDGVNQRLLDCVDALHDLGIDVVLNPTYDARAKE